ncbi:hypothetical protein [Streptomyces sp. WELS2]|uniref:hypothetical protein n=1 Tax=Streptomyces sp. WELS2 TaxID=2749435 RepID=UPI0015F028EC|nr:hypothetical protein [Streptomyces sp. WELS2]
MFSGVPGDGLEAGEAAPELLVHAATPVLTPTTSSAATARAIALLAPMSLFLLQAIDQGA